MSLLKEVNEKCLLALNGGAQRVPLSGHSRASVTTARCYVSNYNRQNAVDLRTSFMAEDNELAIFRRHNFTVMVPPKAGKIRIPFRLYKFLNGGRYDPADLVEIENFSKELVEFIAGVHAINNAQEPLI